MKIKTVVLFLFSGLLFAQASPMFQVIVDQRRRESMIKDEPGCFGEFEIYELEFVQIFSHFIAPCLEWKDIYHLGFANRRFAKMVGFQDELEDGVGCAIEVGIKLDHFAAICCTFGSEEQEELLQLMRRCWVPVDLIVDWRLEDTDDFCEKLVRAVRENPWRRDVLRGLAMPRILRMSASKGLLALSELPLEALSLGSMANRFDFQEPRPVFDVVRVQSDVIVKFPVTLRSLELIGVRNLSGNMLDNVGGTCERLEHLALMSDQVELAKRCCNLKSIRLEGYNQNFVWLQFFPNTISRIELVNCDTINLIGMKQSFPKLESLTLDNCPEVSRANAQFFDDLPDGSVPADSRETRGDGLKELRLRNVGDHMDRRAVQRAIEKAPCLRVFELTGGLDSWGGLSFPETLKSLVLVSNQPAHEGDLFAKSVLEYFSAQELNGRSNLEIFVCKGFPLTLNSIIYVPKSLRVLNLDDSVDEIFNIGHAGLMFGVLKMRCRKLRHFSARSRFDHRLSRDEILNQT